MKAERNVKGLIKTLEDGDLLVRKAAAETLGDIADPQAIIPLINSGISSDLRHSPLGDLREFQFYSATIDALAKIGTPAVKILIDRLESNIQLIDVCCKPSILPHRGFKDSESLDNSLNRGLISYKFALSCLRRIGGSEAESYFVKLMRTGLFPEHRSDAAISLMHANWTVDVLIHALEDEDEDVLKSAVIALESIGDEKAIPPLIEIMKRKWHSLVRQRAAEALVKFGASAITPLVWAFKMGEPEENARSDDTSLRAIGRKIGKPAILPAVTLLDNRGMPTIRCNAVNILSEINDESTIEPLIRALDDEDSKVKLCAAIALGHKGDERALPFLRSVRSELGPRSSALFMIELNIVAKTFGSQAKDILKYIANHYSLGASLQQICGIVGSQMSNANVEGLLDAMEAKNFIKRKEKDGLTLYDPVFW
jgi:HEAT repeat protein